MTTKRRLVAFAGLKGVGKDTAAAVFCGYGYRNLKFAGGLKAMLRALVEWQDPTADVQRMIEGDLREVPSPLLGGRTPRHAMQTLGTEWGRDLMAADLWVEAAERSILSLMRRSERAAVVISDLRFPNEAALVKRLGGVVVMLTRPGLEADRHTSESGIADLPADLGMINDFATQAEFEARVETGLLPFIDRRGAA